MKYIHKISGFLGAVAGICICAGMALILIEILVRKLLGSTIYIVDEYTAYLAAASFYFALGVTQRDGAHIRMTALRSFINPKAAKWVDMFCYFVAICFGAFLTYSTFIVFYESMVLHTRAMSISETYLAIPQVVMPIGALAYTLQVLVILFELSGSAMNPTDNDIIQKT